MDRNKIILRQVMKYSSFILIVVILYIFQSTPYFFNFFGIGVNLLLPFCIVLSLLNTQTQSIFVYIVAGMLNEFSLSRLVGFHTLLLIVLSIISAIIINYFLNPSLKNTAAYTFFSMVIILSIDFIFVYAFRGYTNLLPFYFSKVILTSLYSCIFVVVYYYLILIINNRFIRYNAR